MTKISTTSESDGFSIGVIDESPSGSEMPYSQTVGRVQVGSFTETFLMDLSFWTVDEYRQSWREALNELESTDKATSCLVSSITDPVTSSFISCWPLYRDGELVYVQNSIIFLDELDEPFDPQQPWRHVEPHHSVDEDGNPISEWVTRMSQVRLFRASA